MRCDRAKSSPPSASAPEVSITTKMRPIASIIAGLALLIGPAAASENLFVVLQDATGAASPTLFNATSGVEMIPASETWHFTFPLVESAADPSSKKVFTITYPKETGVATLYQFDAATSPSPSLETASVTTSNNSYFDLQFAPKEDLFYGIFVESTYGRVLSAFPGLGTAANGTAVSHVPIAELPFSWYVNASCVDDASSTYFGLLNVFPHFPNFTSAQKLAVGDFSNPKARTARFVDLAPAPGAPEAVIHFLAYSQPISTLFGFAQLEGANNETACFVTIDPSSGLYSCYFSVSPLAVGPIVASKSQPVLYAMANNADDQTRILGSMDVSGAANNSTSNDDDSALFSFISVFDDTNVAASMVLIDW